MAGSSGRNVVKTLEDMSSRMRIDPHNSSGRELPHDLVGKALEDATEITMTAEQLVKYGAMLARHLLARPFPNLQKLELQGGYVTKPGEMRKKYEGNFQLSLLKCVAKGHMPSLKSLTVSRLAIGESGMGLIAQAVDRGHLTNLSSLELNHNGIRDLWMTEAARSSNSIATEARAVERSTVGQPRAHAPAAQLELQAQTASRRLGSIAFTGNGRRGTSSMNMSGRYGSIDATGYGINRFR